MISNTRRVALSGIMAAIAILSLLFAAIMPTSKLSFYALSSFFISVIIIEYDAKSGWIFYIFTNLLAFILIPNKIRVIPYTVFFGIYGIIKYYIERLNNIISEYIIKYVYFNACLVIAIILFKKIFTSDTIITNMKFPLWISIILLEVVFALYDYVYTLVIQYYRQKLRRYLKLEK